jgi:mycofactocin precursor
MSESVSTAKAEKRAVAPSPAGPSAAPRAESPEPGQQAGQPQVALTDLLVEEVSIDGMCGVY